MENDKQKGGAAVMEAPEQKSAAVTEAPEQKTSAAAPAQSAPADAKPAEAQTPKKQERTFLYTFIVLLYLLIAKLFFFMKIEGKENVPKGKNCVLMGNHQCLLDSVTLALCAMDREIHFMGKKELFENKVLGWVFTKVHGFPVDRGNMDMAAVRTAMGVLKEGDTLGIFPEGTRSKAGPMLPLLGGASMIALKSGCDVVPVYIDGRYKLFHRIVVRVGKPISTEDIRRTLRGKEAVDALTAQIEQSFFELSGGKSRAA